MERRKKLKTSTDVIALLPKIHTGKSKPRQAFTGQFWVTWSEIPYRMKTLLSLITLLGLLSLQPVQGADPRVGFVSHVKPLLTSRCINCHNAGALFGQLSLENKAMAFKKRANGPVIVPGRPDSSALYLVLKMPPKNPKAMPPAGHRVTDREVNLIYDWIKQGAEWPEGKDGVIVPLKKDRRVGS